MTTISMLVPAAGCGARTKLDRNKILAPIHGRPLLWWTLHALCAPDAMPADCRLIELIVAAKNDEIKAIESVFGAPCGTLKPSCGTLRPFCGTLEALCGNLNIELRVVEGGDNRQASVENAARAARGDFVAVHDAARPLVSPQLIARVIAAAQTQGAAIAALPVSDTVKLANENGAIGQTLDRNRVWLAQTPQIFARPILLEAFSRAAREQIAATDCASLVENWAPVALVEGETSNFKVTFSGDIERAAELLKDAI